MRDGRLVGTGETGILAADQIFKAIGQTLRPDRRQQPQLEGGRIAVDAEGRTSWPASGPAATASRPART